ncbi:MAG TPA: hypothetical protein PLL78_09325 [Fimbriimonadaceae bacterium]|nr:hypothetical protein [Fimbriimonadaceae bacterium]
MALATTNPITGQPYRKGYNPGSDSGAITFEWLRPLVLTATIRPFRDPKGERYTIEANRTTGHVRCSCQAYHYAREQRGGTYASLTDPKSGWCKHIRAWYEQIAREIIERNTQEAADQIAAELADINGFWQRTLDELPTGLIAIYRGEAYKIGEEFEENRKPGQKSAKGSGGRRFRIRFSDGREVLTTNLWVRGRIPAVLRTLLADNAVVEEVR